MLHCELKWEMSARIPSSFDSSTYKTERSAVAVLMYWMREIIEQHNLDLGLPDVDTSGADRKSPDIVIYESRRSQNVLCLIEAKLPYFDVFDEPELKRPAWEKANRRLGPWLKERCEREHLSLRQAGTKTGLSHSTIYHAIKGSHPSLQSIKKLAQGFGRDGINQRAALEDRLLVLAGYRTERPRKKLSEPLAQLIDKAKRLNEPRIKMVTQFVDFLIEILGED